MHPEKRQILRFEISGKPNMPIRYTIAYVLSDDGLYGAEPEVCDVSATEVAQLKSANLPEPKLLGASLAESGEA